MRKWIDPELEPRDGALRGVRVLEVGDGIASAFAARVLADHGASVVKATSAPPASGPHGVSVELSAYLNWNKFGVTVEPGSDLFAELLETADVLVVGDEPATVRAWGVDLTALRSTHPRLTAVAITPFGLEGPRSEWPWSELIVQAAGGLMRISGTVDREPLMRGLRQSRYEAGLNGAYTAIVGVYAARRTGEGAGVDLSIAETVTSELVLNHASYMFLGGVQGRRALTSDKLATGDPVATADGFATVQVNTLIPPAAIGRVFDEPRLGDAAFATREGRRRNASQLDEVLRDLASRYTAKAFFEKGAFGGLLTGFVQTADQLLKCEQLAARDAWVEVGVPEDGADARRLRFVSRLGSMSRTPSHLLRDAPVAGEHDGDLVELPAAETVAGEVAPGAAPLAGLRVIDLSTVFAVPYMGGLLADLGAEVIKVEPPDRLDQTRGGGFGPWIDNRPEDDSWNRSGTFHEINRGKRSIVLNLKSEQGREVLEELVRTADIVLDNFTPRVLRGWGLTYDALREINPRIIHLSNNGYGSTGPWSSFKAQGTTLEATMGISSVCGYTPGTPSKIGQSYPDFIATWSGLTMIMAALVERTSSALGQWIDLGMYQLGPVVIPEALVSAQTGGPVPRPSGNREYGALYSAVVGSDGPEGWTAVSVPDRDAWSELRRVVTGLPVDPPRSPEELGVVDELVHERLAGSDGHTVAATLRAAGVAVAPVANARDLAHDRHLAERGFYEPVDFGPEIGVRTLIGRPYRWISPHPVEVRGPGAAWGADTSSVLASAGYDAARLADLAEAGVVAPAPVGAVSFAPTDLDDLVATGVHAFFDPDYRDAALLPGSRR